MKADDIKPNRLEKAKEVIDTFLSKNTSLPIGYIVFAGKPFVLTPRTTDRESLRTMVQDTYTESINQGLKDTSGTNIGDALILGNSLITSSGSKGSIILITDGRANIGIDPLIAAKESAKQGIRIYTIGIGEASG